MTTMPIRLSFDHVKTFSSLGRGSHPAARRFPMLPKARIAAGLALIFSMTTRDVHAQWGYGGWGWGGWGASTPGSAAAQGAGYYAMGAGMYNLDTAQARSINADTAMRWNQYAYLSNQEQARKHAERKNADLQKNKSLYDAHQKQLRENPERRQIENGDALNAAVADLSDPRLGSAAVRAAYAPVPAAVIAEVPFRNASERVTIMLDGIRESVKWPKVFNQERFANLEQRFNEIRGRVRGEAQEGDVSAGTLREAKSFVDDLRAKLEAQPLQDPADQKDALAFVNGCTSLLGMLEHPDIRPALVELRKVTDTTIGNLLGFMNAYNLRFGAATTPKQRQAYDRLYPILDQTRDSVLAAAKLESPATATVAKTKDMTDFLENLNQANKRGGSPSPGRPGRPE
jgi:hypothetical protein